jgi:hypothetical protein
MALGEGNQFTSADPGVVPPEVLGGSLMRSSIRLLVPAAALALAAFSPASAHAQQRVRCESHGYDRSYCNADTRGGVQIVRQLSDASCREGRSWGTSSRGIWVSNGCRADFVVGSSYGGGYNQGGYGQNGGYGGGYGRDGRREDDGRYGRKDGSRHGRWDDRRRGGYGNSGGYGNNGGYGTNGGYGNNGGYGGYGSSSQAAGLCRAEVQRKVGSARNGNVSVSGATFDSRYDAYFVQWNSGRDQGTCEVRRDGQVRISRGGSRY